VGFFTPDLTPADWRAVLVRAGNRGIHNFSFGCCAAYFGLLAGKAQWLDECVLHIASLQGRHKTWVFDVGELVPDFKQLAELQKLGPVYSQFELASFPGQSTFKEVTYDLEEVFDPASYPSKKKRYQRLTYPPRWIENHEVELSPITIDDLPVLHEIHEEWAEAKLADPHTYQLMFPRKRYFECCRLAARYPEWFTGYKVTMSKRGVVGARVLYREGDWAFDLAQFTAPQALPSASEYFAYATMAALRDEGVRYLNCGASLNSSLSGFKSHWPHSTRSHWAYSQQKDKVFT
jgi:hypothetical protein